ncbi:hypothetical protein [Nitrosopumilus sp.]|uniref:hypothetical protein n=1 Tax=Nitrosopumilus sp. TaxID=2024843 RepID=UPI00247D5603|nr:hypothetical protein [Nitrosopumilus sp.]MCV0410160.1 hypothetical protein [Nitrosopumilus sp.]
MNTRALIIIGIVLASVVLISSFYVISVQNKCETMLGDRHYPRPLTLWTCLHYLSMIENPPPKSSTVIPEPQQVPIPEDTGHKITDTYVKSIQNAESTVDFELSIPSYLPQGYALDTIKIDKQKTRATITYLPEDFKMDISPYVADNYYAQYGALVIIHHSMGKNFNMTYYLEDIPRLENKKIYDLNGTYAEGIDYDAQTLSSVKIFREDRMKVDVWWNGTTDALLPIIESMNLDVPHVTYTPDSDYVSGEPEPIPEPESELEPTAPSGIQVEVTGQQQVRRGTTHDIVVNVTRDGYAVSDALVRITIEDYGENIIRDFTGRTDDSGRFVFSWEIPKIFDDIKTLLAYVDVTDDISAKTILFKFQVYCLPGETGCKVEGN